MAIKRYAVNNGNQVGAFVLDFSKAFDRVPHKILLYKPSHYGINGSILNWIGMFLTQRTQKVALEENASNQCDVISGVPQGTTVLAPLLFLLYINDLPLSISSTTRLFADDCLLYRAIASPMDGQILQDDLNALSKWEKDWQMSFILEKMSHNLLFYKGECYYTIYSQSSYIG